MTLTSLVGGGFGTIEFSKFQLTSHLVLVSFELEFELLEEFDHADQADFAPL